MLKKNGNMYTVKCVKETYSEGYEIRREQSNIKAFHRFVIIFTYFTSLHSAPYFFIHEVEDEVGEVAGERFLKPPPIEEVVFCSIDHFSLEGWTGHTTNGNGG